jgi:hypothetical protein
MAVKLFVSVGGLGFLGCNVIVFMRMGRMWGRGGVNRHVGDGPGRILTH